MTSIHPYFVGRARLHLHKAGGDPAQATALAAWAEEAHQINDRRRGVVVAEDGELIAATRYDRKSLATYVTREDTQRYALTTNEVGLALGALCRITGKRLIHVTMSDVCTGASHSVPKV